MSNPYWGQLPPPNVLRQNPVNHEDLKLKGKGLAVDTGRLSGGSQPKQNRASVDAPTISTQSPFASPVPSSFQGDGLTPRPPSFALDTGVAPNNTEFLDRRRRRENRYRDQIGDDATPSPVPPPAAPEPPRAPPPLSYRDPYGQGQFPPNFQAPMRSPSTRKSDGPVSPNSMQVAEEYYRSGKRGEGPVAENGIYVAEEVPIRGSSNGKAVLQDVGAERPDAHQSQRRKGSLSETEAKRRREFAPDRSPLQRLELTLDSITKEEKRARIEEAELVAREAKAGRGGERSNQSSVRFRNRQNAKGPESAKQREPQSLPEAGLVRNLSNKQKDQLQRSATVEEKRPSPTDMRGFDYQPHSDNDHVSQNKPTSKGRARLPAGTAAALAAGAGAGAAAVGLGRSGSNKLKKNPAGDPWLHRRTDAEKRYPDIVPRRGSVDNGRQSVPGEAGPSKATTVNETPQTAGVHSPVTKADPGFRHPLEPFDPTVPSDKSKIPVRRGSSKKVQQLIGKKESLQVSKPMPAIHQQDPENVSAKKSRPESGTGHGVKFAESLTSGDPPGQHNGEHHNYLHMLQRRKHRPGEVVFTPSPRLYEWKQGGVARLCENLLDIHEDEKSDVDKDKTWWEAGHNGRRRSSTRNRAEAYDGEYADSNAPTRFKPHLYLECGPLLRYCGLRRERRQGRSSIIREIWRGSVMIVTRDADSSYELAPTLRLFLQPINLLPPPPREVNGDIPPEYVDPIAGLPKIDRDGRTLYTRPVDHLPEERDISNAKPDHGLFEKKRSVFEGEADFQAKLEHLRPKHDGEKAGKHKEVRGFRLHAERGLTFWRFNIEVELRDTQQRIAYRINHGPATGFWIPPRNHAMNIMFHSCNGFSTDVNPNQLSGPDPMWRDVLNTHQTQPFHVMLGGGGQVYNDAVMDETVIFKEWLDIKDPLRKEVELFTPDMQDELESFYLERYCKWFSQGLFGLANSQIPMVNMWDDHDILDGFGSYPHGYMSSPVMSGLGNVAFKYYMLFQHQSSIDEGEEEESSWLLGTHPGPYISEMGRNIFTHVGRSIAFLGLDCRTERTNDNILAEDTYEKVLARLKRDIIKGETKHLIVMLGVPIAYPRMAWLENILTSRLLMPVKALGRAGILGKKAMNRLDGDVEVLDDLDGHWTAKHHKAERFYLIKDLQDIAQEKSVRVTILSGDVHLGAIGHFFSNPKLGIPKDHDFRYMPNVISSAIVNTPPPDMLADVLNRRNKVHHLDVETDEDMIPIFTHVVDGKVRNNRTVLNRRNWCSIREFDLAFASPPPSPTPSNSSEDTESIEASRPGFLRRLSTSRAVPPLTHAGGFFSKGREITACRYSTDSERPGVLKRTLSLTRQDFLPGVFRNSSRRRRDDGGDDDDGPESEDDVAHHTHSSSGGLFRWRSKRRSDNGGINGYGSDTEEEDMTPPPSRKNRAVGIRGRSGGPEDDAEGYFPPYKPTKAPNARHDHHNNHQHRDQDNDHHPNPHHPNHHHPPATKSISQATTSVAGGTPLDGLPPRNQFRRRPTGLSLKQIKRGGSHARDINLEGGLDICLNMEVSAKDPSGITMPYRLLVPALWCEEDDVEEEEMGERGRVMGKGMQAVGGMVRKLSRLGRGA